ncbi:MAG TPA: hypothetical protein VHB21_05390 [Minicystis sp.]|nr:hypothetical protein [Minicystis sp.]
MAGKTNHAYPYSIKKDFDGSGIGREEELSVQRVTRAVEASTGQKTSDSDAKKAWKKKVIQRLKDYGFDKDANYLEQHWGDDDWLTDGDAFGDVYSGKVWGGKNPYANHVWGTSKHNPPSSTLAGAMEGNDKNGKHIKGKERLMHDSSFQQITSVMRKHADGSTKTPNPETDNYAVAKKANRLVKVDYDNGQTHWMPSDDTNSGSDISGAKGANTSNAGELSNHAATAYGGSNVNMHYAGTLGPHPGYLTNDEWDEIGKNGYTNPDGTIPNNPDQLAAARKARGVKAPPATSSSGGGPLLLYGYWSLMHGADTRCVGFANAESVHAAGGFMMYGSNTTFVSPSFFPVSRVGDGTSDGKAAVTGAGDCFIGGSPATSGPGK